jgi:peptidylprolyl isomerase
MSKTNLFIVLLLSCVVWAIPYKVETVKEGSGDPIRAGQLIKVHYKGFLAADSALMLAPAAPQKAENAENDKNKAKDVVAKDSTAAPADSSEDADSHGPFANTYESGEPLEFTIGMGQVIVGWEKGLMGMKVGEVRRLSVPSEMAYGENSLDGIPPNSDLLFEVELVHAEKPMEPDVFPKDVNKLKWKSLSKGLDVYDEKAGSGAPAMTAFVMKVHYTGWILSGRKFASSKELGKPLEVTLGAGKMIKGWEKGLEGMRAGGVRWLRVAPSMGYGATAYTMIPPNSTLIFRVELVSSEIDPEVAERMDFFPDTASLQFEPGSEGLRYVVVKQGEGEPAKSGDRVNVHYTGWLVNGYKFDSSRDRGQPFAFALGGGSVIRGWELGVQGMKPGEKRILVIPPGLGYGSRGAGPIPGGATLIFAVEYLGTR